MIQVDLLFKLAGLGVAVAVISQVLNRPGREELGTRVPIYTTEEPGGAPG